jgi:hypothetical protein
MGIHTISTREEALTICPTLVVADDGDAVRCGTPLVVTAIATVRGDDYGSWTEYDAGFACGHTFEQMRSSLRMEEFI